MKCVHLSLQESILDQDHVDCFLFIYYIYIFVFVLVLTTLIIGSTSYENKLQCIALSLRQFDPTRDHVHNTT